MASRQSKSWGKLDSRGVRLFWGSDGEGFGQVSLYLNNIRYCNEISFRIISQYDWCYGLNVFVHSNSYIKIFIGVQLIGNALVVSGVHQSE